MVAKAMDWMGSARVTAKVSQLRAKHSPRPVLYLQIKFRWNIVTPLLLLISGCFAVQQQSCLAVTETVWTAHSLSAM